MRNRHSTTRLRKRSPLLGIEGLEDRVVPAAILNITNAPTGVFPLFDLVDPAGGVVSGNATFLPSGNVVVVGSSTAYLFNGTTGAHISTLTDGAGSVTVLTDGNYVIQSPFWRNAAGARVGAVTWGSGVTGVSGVRSATNSLVGSREGDSYRLGRLPAGTLVYEIPTQSVTLLSNGNYTVSTPNWDDGTVVDATALTWSDGTKGVSGVIAATNSLIGAFGRVTPLVSGNFVVSGNRGITWVDGTKGITGKAVDAVTVANSLITAPFTSVTQLSSGNYLVRTDKGVTWGDGNKGVSGDITAANTLIGSGLVTELTNGNYLVSDPYWDNGAVTDAGAVTWGSGTTGISGNVSAANSLIGSQSFDSVGIFGVTPLTNGNYVVSSRFWNNGAVADAGAVTWGDGDNGRIGFISTANSLVGTQDFDQVGISGITALSNGNYVVGSGAWNNGAVVDVGAATWGDGAKGLIGFISTANSLVGSQTFDQVGSSGITALSNGNYVVGSGAWNNGAVAGAGAVTWGDGTKVTSGVVSAANSLVGSQTNDQVGSDDLTTLLNGNYLVRSPFWDNGAVVDAGAVTWGDGTKVTSAIVDATNSLVGSHTDDFKQFRLQFAPITSQVVVLADGDYLIVNSLWDNGAVVDAGAVTWGDGTKGVSGAVSANNSLVGSQTKDYVGNYGVTELTNGNYVVRSPNWDERGFLDAGAVTWGDGSKGIRGLVSPGNSLVGSNFYDYVGTSNSNRSESFFPFDTITIDGVMALTNGNYVVNSPGWDNGALSNSGAVTWGDGTRGTKGAITADNSFLGNQNGYDRNVSALSTGNYVVSNSTDVGPITVWNGTTGRTIDGANTITPQNSIIGSAADTSLNYLSSSPDGQLLVISSQGPLRIADANLLTFDRSGSKTIDVSPNLFALSLNSGQDVLSQATATINVTSPIVVDNPIGNGGALTLQSQGALNLNANITTDNGNLTLLGTTITPAAGVTVNTGTGTLNLPNGKLVLHQALTVNGGVNLSGVALNVQLPVPTNPGQIITLIDKQIAGAIVGTFAGLPQGETLTLNGLAYTISYTGGDGNDVVLTPPVMPVLVGVPQFAAGTDVGGGTATLFNADKSARFAVAPFAGFTGGVHTAAADFNGDGVADLIVGTGPGIATRVLVLDGKTQAELFSVAPFEASFTGGVYVSAGDVNGDGIPDLAITPDEGGGPRADVYSGAIGFPKIASFFGIDDVNFRGGARSAIADMTGDGTADLIVVAGFGGGPRVAAFDGKSLSTGTPVKIFGDFFAFEQALRNGIFVTAGDINGDGFADLIAGGGPGGGPRVLALDGKSLLSNQYVNLANFFGGDINSRGGIRVAVKNLDGDNRADLVVGSGAGAGSRVTGYLGKNIAADGTPTAQFDFDALAGFSGGVFVG